MVAVKFHGRLGNQLFQYAFIYATAKKFKTGFYIDYSMDENYLSKYFQLRLNRQQILDRYLLNRQEYNKITFFLKSKLSKYIANLQEISISNDIDPSQELQKLENNRLYKGHFQSEAFFKGFQSEIKNLYKIKKKYLEQFSTRLKSLPPYKKLITIHVRRGDYLHLQWNLPNEYYHNAIKMTFESENQYVIITDDPEFVVNEFDYLKNIYISRNSEIIDLQFLINADCCILSNSSFSWWGAYLNKKNAKVFAPKYWLGSETGEFPKSILLNNWTIV